MTTGASLVYSVAQGGADLTDLSAAVAAVPLPLDLLAQIGARVTSDNTTEGPPVVRTVDLSFVPTVAATATASTLSSQPTGSPVTKVTIGTHGTGYIAPPGVEITDTLETGTGAAAKAFLNVDALGVGAGGASYDETSFVSFYGGLPPASGLSNPQAQLSPGQSRQTFLKVLRVAVSAGGSNYSPKTVVTFVGGLSPRGTPAQGSVTLRAGVIVSIDVEDVGDEYLTAPQIVITDPTGAGSGAAAAPYMNPGKVVNYQGTPATASVTITGGAVTAVTLLTPGDGYIGIPKALVVDPTGAGAGAAITVDMQVGKVVVTNGGVGYQEPAVALVPRYFTFFPNGSDLRAPLWNLMTKAIASAVASPVAAAAPVLS
jgi:hypothetical protein